MITFEAHQTTVEPLRLSFENRQRLQQWLMLFFTGSSRSASEILSRQSQASRQEGSSTVEALHRVKEMAYEVRKCLEAGDLPRFGELLHENWEQKKRFAAGISNPVIDQCYELARREGAIGGKITGAGGGGFLMLCCPPERQQAVSQALESQGLKRMDFRFEESGARVLMNAGLRLKF